MPVTWRTELGLTCENYDQIHSDDDCDLILDQANARTKRGMIAIARKAGWTIIGNKCLCPECSAKLRATPKD